ncbi:MAG: enoyl-CoA hydratase/isomerase family protein [Acidobacteriota bacterium]
MTDRPTADEPTSPDVPTGDDASLHLVVDDRIATLIIDRPPLNVLDLDLLERLDAALDALDPAGLQALVVRGAGGHAFSAGVAVEDHDPSKIDAMLGIFHRALRRLLALDVATIAAVDGHCLGGGMELAASCDFVVATGKSTFGQPEIKLGCFPPFAAVVLPHRIGPGAAADLVLTGRTLDADEAWRLGFVDRLANDDLELELERLLEHLRRSSAAVLACAKRALRVADPRRKALEDALTASERIYREDLAATDDLREGVAAFLDKRPADWRHR